MSIRDYQIEIYLQVWPGRRRCYRWPSSRKDPNRRRGVGQV